MAAAPRGGRPPPRAPCEPVDHTRRAPCGSTRPVVQSPPLAPTQEPRELADVVARPSLIVRPARRRLTMGNCAVVDARASVKFHKKLHATAPGQLLLGWTSSLEHSTHRGTVGPQRTASVSVKQYGTTASPSPCTTPHTYGMSPIHSPLYCHTGRRAGGRRSRGGAVTRQPRSSTE